MKPILLTKLASMGDLVHLLPALTDAQNALPGVCFDWVIDKNFQEVASWHPSVRRRILTEHRKWRSSLWKKATRQAIEKMIRTLREESYDLVIDAQGNFKSALIGHLAHKKKIVGWDGASIPEWGAHYLYTKSYPASKKEHAIDRLRKLLAASLGYPCPSSPPDYGIDKNALPPFSAVALPKDFLVLVPIASTENKLWPEHAWKELIELITKELSLPIFLPWGSLPEKARAESLCATSPLVQVLPRLRLSELAALFLKARAIVSLDTGLGHIAAALGTPAVSLYGSTDPKRTGTIGSNQLWLQAPQNDLSLLEAKEVFSSLLTLLPLRQ